MELLSRWFIRDRDNVTDPRVRRAYGQLCGFVGIGLNILLFAGKFFAGTLSGSVAITADAFNNLSDAGSSVVTLLGFRLAGKKPDPQHPFGHGRLEYVSGLIVAGLILLEILLAGGMYPNALLTGIVLFFVMLDVLAGKKYSKTMKLQGTALFLVFLPAFGLSFIAPGNARRQAYFQHRTPFEAIYKSYTKSLDYMFNEATNVVIVLVILALFLYMLWKLKDSSFSFRCPFLFTLVSYSMVVVMWVPGIYAVRFISGGRYFNILYYGVVLFYAANAVYYAGWLRRQCEKCGEEVMGLLTKAAPAMLGVVAVGCVVLGMWKINIVTNLEEITSATALKSIVYGEAKVYHEEIKAREKLYNDPAVKDVVVDEVTYRPELLYYGTLTTDPNDGRNLAMCEYYDKDSMVKYDPEGDGDSGAEDTEETDTTEAESAE